MVALKTVFGKESFFFAKYLHERFCFINLWVVKVGLSTTYFQINLASCDADATVSFSPQLRKRKWKPRNERRTKQQKKQLNSNSDGWCVTE